MARKRSRVCDGMGYDRGAWERGERRDVLTTDRNHPRLCGHCKRRAAPLSGLGGTVRGQPTARTWGRK